MRKSQGSFEYILLLGGVMLVVVLSLIIMRSTILGSANTQLNQTTSVLENVVSTKNVSVAPYGYWIFISSPTNITENNKHYKLSSDISCDSGCCIGIYGNNTVLDCDNHEINGEGSAQGICAKDVYQLNIRNCKINQTTVAVHFSDVNSSTVSSANVIAPQKSGVAFENSNRNTIKYNTLNGSSDSWAIYLSSPYSQNNIFTHNTILNSKKGIAVAYSSVCSTAGHKYYVNSSNTFSYNTIRNASDDGVLLNSETLSLPAVPSNNQLMPGNTYYFSSCSAPDYYYTSKNTLSNNNIFDNGNNGIYLENSRYNSLTSNTANNNSQSGVALDSSSNNTFNNNNVLNNGGDGVYLTSSDYNIISNNVLYFNHDDQIHVEGDYNTITNNNATYNHSADSICGLKIIGNNDYASNGNFISTEFANGSDMCGAWLQGSNNSLDNIYSEKNDIGYACDTYNSTTNNFRVNTSGTAGIVFYNSPENGSFVYNSTVVNSSSDVYVYGDSSTSHGYLINVSFNKSSVFFHSSSDVLWTKWYVHMTAPSGSTVEIFDNDSNLVYNETSSGGSLPVAVITEYNQTSGGVYNFTPHTFNVSGGSCAGTTSTKHNVTTNLDLNLTCT